MYTYKVQSKRISRHMRYETRMSSPNYLHAFLNYRAINIGPNYMKRMIRTDEAETKTLWTGDEYGSHKHVKNFKGEEL